MLGKMASNAKEKSIKSHVMYPPEWVKTVSEHSVLLNLCARYYEHQHSEKIRTVVDVGANKGQSIRRFRELFPQAQIVSIEPAKSLVEELRDEFAVSERIKLLQFAMSNSNGDIELFHSAVDQCNSVKEPWQATGTSEKVACRKLDTLCEEQGLEHVHILKVDTEGHDVEVLEGAKGMLEKGAIDLILVECGFLPDDPHHANFYSIAELLKPYGFNLAGFSDARNCEWQNDVFSLTYCNGIFARAQKV